MKFDMKLDWLGWMIGRILVALLFIPAGLFKFLKPEHYLAHMAEFDVPGALLPLVGGFEMAAGIAILLGFYLRYSAIAIGLFCILTAVIFHADWVDNVERTMFVKNIAIAGGAFILAFSLAPRRYLQD